MDNHPCCFVDGGFKPCRALLDRLQWPSSAKGLRMVRVVNEETMDQTLKGVVYAREAKDAGLLLNFCPWCGEKIKHPDYEGRG